MGCGGGGGIGGAGSWPRGPPLWPPEHLENPDIGHIVDAMKSQEWEDWLATNPSLFKGGTKALVPIEEDTVEYMGKLVDVYKILESLGYY